MIYFITYTVIQSNDRIFDFQSREYIKIYYEKKEEDLIRYFAHNNFIYLTQKKFTFEQISFYLIFHTNE